MSKGAQAKILDELCELTGWHPDHARKALREALGPRRTPAPRKARPRLYGEDVMVALRKVWAVMDAPARKRMAPFLAEIVAGCGACGELASRDGELPIVCGAASCTEGLEILRDLAANAGSPFTRLRFVDAIEFIHDHVLDQLEITAPIPSIALHPTCSSSQLGTNEKMTAIATAISPNVFLPIEWGCCEFAGDGGLLHLSSLHPLPPARLTRSTAGSSRHTHPSTAPANLA